MSLDIEKERREFEAWANELNHNENKQLMWSAWLAAKRSTMGAEPVAREAIRLAVQRITEIQKRDGGKAWHLAKATLSNDLAFVAQGLIDALVVLPPTAPPSTDAKDADRWRAIRQCFIGVVYETSDKGMAEFTCHIPQHQYKAMDPNGIADAAIAAKEPTK